MNDSKPNDASKGTDPKRVAFGEFRKSMIEGGDHSLSGMPIEFKPDPAILAQEPKMFRQREDEKRAADAKKGTGGVGGLS